MEAMESAGLLHTQEVFPVAFTASTSSAMRPGQRVRHQTKCKNYVFRLPVTEVQTSRPSRSLATAMSLTVSPGGSRPFL